MNDKKFVAIDVLEDEYKSMLRDMRELQAEVNDLLLPGWQSTPAYQWQRAFNVEVGELQGHLNYKWWYRVKSPIDYDQAIMEVVDLWAFGLSHLEVREDEAARFASVTMYDVCAQTAARMSIHEGGDQNRALNTSDALYNNISFRLLTKIIGLLGFKFDYFYALFVGKSILNRFRYRHGGRTGNYVKIWNGLEDNEVLTKYVRVAYKLKYRDSALVTYLHSRLSDEYNALFK